MYINNIFINNVPEKLVFTISYNPVKASCNGLLKASYIPICDSN